MSHPPAVQARIDLAASKKASSRAGARPHRTEPRKEHDCGCGGKAKAGPPREVYPGLVDPLQNCVCPTRNRNASVSHENVWDHINALQMVAEGPVPPCPDRSGDGVIICGEGRYAVMVGMAVRALRHDAKWDGVIEVWHRPSAGGIEAAKLGGLGVTLVDADAVVKALPAHQRPRILSGWGLKTLAAIHSKLRRVFQLDADALCFANPKPLFAMLDDTPHVYWQDPTDFVRGPWHGLSRAEIRAVPPVNSGHMLLDVPARWHELLIARWIDDHEEHWCDRKWQPRHKLHQWGDQCSHRCASAYKGSRVKVIGPARQTAEATVFVCDWRGSPAIVHHHGRKFWPDAPPARDDTLPFEARAWELYAEVTDAPPVRPYKCGMTEPQYARVVEEIERRAPCRVLVFGAGHDTARYVAANRGGRTVVLEDLQEWLAVAREAGAETYAVRYTTRLADGPRPDVVALEVPASVAYDRFDVVLIDGPDGLRADAPGRQQPAALAARLVAPGGVILAHDSQPGADADCYARHLGLPGETVGGPPDLAVYRAGPPPGGKGGDGRATIVD